MKLERVALQRYLDSRHGGSVHIGRVSALGGNGEDALKQFGYGLPMLVEYTVDGTPVREVFHRIRPNQFGRERADDRAAAVWFDYTAFNKLPSHVPATDMLAHLDSGALCSLCDADELVLVTGYRPGNLYADDLMRIRDGDTLQRQDLQRAAALARYLARIHGVSRNDPVLWRRRLRDLVGHGEGIMGLTDSYPSDFALADAERLRRIEDHANRWRWHLKPLHHRLSQVHGDFHPYNILFAQGEDLCVLDRSRGEWGEPADDVSCLTINYIFFGFQRDGDLTGPFRELYDCFWETYLAARPDGQIGHVIQPWYAWRALVVASPIWYPTIPESVRSKLLTFAERAMEADEFDHRNPDRYWSSVA